ncbi:hypothetical protein LAV73_06760 [Lysinibacillus xylanilyticus]|uniref:hypothetical protein n=1 Tax=Lysinibacillus xylanilyticus TaxID=582475 RepID=UPI002B246222|nr:hypothetical protein [Lysinibacillus xylanilyticus]MEB2279701.1 hypothetical protein [Lysinibacillus xylanilyticus]
MKFYRVKPESKYYKAILTARNAEKKLLEITQAVRKEFDLPDCDQYSVSPDYYFHDVEVLEDEQLKAFTQKGMPKKNSKLGKQIIAFHDKLVEDANLKNIETERIVNFAFGIMRRQGETLERLNGLDTMYIKSDTDFRYGAIDHLEEITEADYVKAYLSALEAKEGAKNETKV